MRCLITAFALLAATDALAAGTPSGPPATPPPSAPPPAAPAADAPDTLRVYVMTMSPGDHPFFRFGHNAILIRDAGKRTDLVYNFGTFRFDSPRLIFDFLGGRLTYWLSVSSLPGVVRTYARENRSIAVQELALSAETKRALQVALDDNAQPNKRAYKYDYFLDNCSTRVRDAVDRAVGGRLQASARVPGRFTLREHALRMTAEPLWLYLALDIVLGPAVDRPIDRWGEMYLPMELARGLAAVTTPEPLAGPAQELLAANRPPPLESPPSRGGASLLVGVVFGLLMAGLGWAARRNTAARIGLGVFVSLWGLAVGFIGCFLIYAWAGTDHVVAHRNQNILLCAPWAIALLVLGVGVALGRPGAQRKAAALALAAVGAVLAALLLKLVLPKQANGALIAFFLPAWLGVAAALKLLAGFRGREASTP
jgi:hypothetical protein